jgi:hypothetical protein
MAIQDDLSSAIAQVISANWADIVNEIEVSSSKMNQLNVSAIIRKNPDATLSFNLKASFKKQTVVSQPTTISVDSAKK